MRLVHLLTLDNFVDVVGLHPVHIVGGRVLDGGSDIGPVGQGR